MGIGDDERMGTCICVSPECELLVVVGGGGERRLLVTDTALCGSSGLGIVGQRVDPLLEHCHALLVVRRPVLALQPRATQQSEALGKLFLGARLRLDTALEHGEILLIGGLQRDASGVMGGAGQRVSSHACDKSRRNTHAQKKAPGAGGGLGPGTRLGHGEMRGWEWGEGGNRGEWPRTALGVRAVNGDVAEASCVRAVARARARSNSSGAFSLARGAHAL